MILEVKPVFNVFTIVMFVIAGCALIGIVGFICYDKFIKPKKAKKIIINNASQDIHENKPEVEAESKVVVCKNCGEKLPVDAIFCSKCGTKLKE